MSIPISTTTVTVIGRRPQVPIDADAEGYDEPPTDPTTLVTGLRATITLPAFKRQVYDTDQVDTYALRTDPFDINRFDKIVDETTGEEYSVVWAGPSVIETFGLKHTIAYIRKSKGAYSGGDLIVPA